MLSGLCIILINWNSKQDTLECIESLLKAGITLEQITLIDNGSVDDSLPTFRERFGQNLPIIENSTNLGFVRACNQGIRKALDQGVQWIMLLNNDTILDAGFFEALQGYMQADSPYAILAPLILYYKYPNLVWNMGDQLIPGTLLTTKSNQRKILPADLPEVIPVDFVTGCAMVVRREVFLKIGLLDPFFEIYYEEIDFCMRARKVGYRMACVPKAKMWHKVSLTMNKIAARASYLRTRNQIIFFRRYSRGVQQAGMFLFSSGRLIIHILKNLLRGQRDIQRSLVRGWMDGWGGPIYSQDTKSTNGNHAV